MFSFIIPLVAGIRYRKHLDDGLQFLLMFLIANLIFEVLVLASVLAHQHASAKVIYEFWPPLEFTLIALMFYAWHDQKIIRRSLLVSIPLFLIFFLVLWGGIFSEDKEKLDTVVLSVECILVVGFAVITMLTSLKRDQTPVLKNPVFWISSALVVYFAGNLFLFALRPMLLHELSITKAKYVWILHSLLNLIKNLLFLGGILACRTRYTSSSSVPSSS